LIAVTMLASGERSKLSAQTFQRHSYRMGLQSRTQLAKEYLRLGMERPLVGHGIRAAYPAAKKRTHSVIQALFVQVGLLGPGIYLAFLSLLAIRGVRELARTTSPSNPGYALLAATFCGCLFLMGKAEVTSDVAGNRELWLFSGVLVNCLIMQRFRWLFYPVPHDLECKAPRLAEA